MLNSTIKIGGMVNYSHLTKHAWMLYLGLFIDFTDLNAELGHKLQMLIEVRDLEHAKVLEQVPFNDKNLVT